jgi:queuosine precursor transporter
LSAGAITQDKKMDLIRRMLPFTAAMAAVVAASNFLVQIPFAHFGLGELLTWAAFTYPIAFLINDLTNRRLGPGAARQVIYSGFAIAVLLSILLATPRIAIASGTAFLLAQLLDTQVFDRLRRRNWWEAPLVSTFLGSILDTTLFFSLAFSQAFAFLDRVTGAKDGSLPFPVPFLGGEAPLWVSLACGDFAVKMVVGVVMLLPYGLFARRVGAAANA